MHCRKTPGLDSYAAPAPGPDLQGAALLLRHQDNTLCHDRTALDGSGPLGAETLEVKHFTQQFHNIVKGSHDSREEETFWSPLRPHRAGVG